MNRGKQHEDHIIEQIDAGYRMMIIMRAPPGGGKTYLAHKLVENCASLGAPYKAKDFILSSDDYFTNAAGDFRYDGELLEEAHKNTQDRALKKAKKAWSPIIIDDNNAYMSELLPYVHIALANGYLVEFFEPDTPWMESVTELIGKTRHVVSPEAMQNTLNTFEIATVSDLLNMLPEYNRELDIPHPRTVPPPPPPTPAAH